MSDSPYKGLAAFDDTEGDALLFFGREREREIIAANLLASRLTILYGPSGVGKSSVLQAGVAHHLRRTAPETAVVIFGSWRDDPARGLATAAAEAAGDGIDPEQPLADVLAACAERVGGDMLVILDQAEEYFLYHDGDDGGGSFAREFPEAVTRPDLRANFLVSLREDSVAKLDRFKGRVPNLFANSLRLDHLDRDEARAAIVGPIDALNRGLAEEERYVVEQELVEAVVEETAAGAVDIGGAGRGVVRETGDADRVEAPYLQLVMQRVWQAEADLGSRRLRLTTFQELGGAERIARDHLEHALDTLTPGQKHDAAAAFEHLVTPSGTKIAHGVHDLADYTRASEQELEPVLAKLESERILRLVSTAGHGGGVRYEIFHDVLAEPVLAWSAAQRAEEDLARERADSRRRQRRLIALASVALAALAAMAVVTVFAFAQRSEARSQRSEARAQQAEARLQQREARSQARRARSRELAANAVTQLEVDPELSTLLALEAARLERTPEVEDVLRRSLVSSRVREVLAGGGTVVDAEFSPDGKLVVTGDRSGRARIFERSTGRVLSELRHSGPVRDVEFSPDGTLAVTASDDRSAVIWDARTGARLATLLHGGEVTSASFSQDGSRIVTSSRDGTVRAWRTAGGRPVWVLSNLGRVSRATFARRRADVILAIGGAKARIIRASDGALLRTLDDRKPISAAAVTPDGRLVVTAGADYDAHVWDAETGGPVHTLVGHLGSGHSGSLNDAAISSDGSRAVTVSEDGTGRVWDVANGALVAILAGHRGSVLSARFSPDGARIVTTSDDLSAIVWDAKSGKALATLLGHTEPPVEASFSPRGSSVVTAGKDGTARLWDPNVDPRLNVVGHLPEDSSAASFGRGGELLAFVDEEGVAGVIDARSGRRLGSFSHEAGGSVTGVRLSMDGMLLLTWSDDGSARLWDVRTGALLQTFKHGAPVEAGAIEPRGRRVVTVGKGVVRIWSAEAGMSGRLLESYRGPATAVAFNADGSLLATGGKGGLAELRNAATGVRLHNLRRHTARVAGIAFSPDGSVLVTTSKDHNAILWDVGTGHRLFVLRAHFGLVRGADFSPDGRWIVTAGPVTAGLWQANAGRFLYYLRGHKGLLLSAAFAANGRRIITAGKDGTIRAYDCGVCGTRDELVALAERRLARTGRTLTASERAQYLER